MKIINWNTRGLGSRKKQRVVKDFAARESECCDVSGNKTRGV